MRQKQPYPRRSKGGRVPVRTNGAKKARKTRPSVSVEKEFVADANSESEPEIEEFDDEMSNTDAPKPPTS